MQKIDFCAQPRKQVDLPALRTAAPFLTPWMRAPIFVQR
jgi:hypothetical protein